MSPALKGTNLTEVRKEKMKCWILLCLIKAKEFHPAQASISSRCSKFKLRAPWSCKVCLEMVQGSDGKRRILHGATEGRGVGGGGSTGGSPYLSFPLHSIPGDFPLFFSLSVQIFFLFIQFSLSNFFDRSSSVSHFFFSFLDEIGRG